MQQAGSLSVIISNYNHAQYITNALEAILSQSYRPLEVIIIDDASVDNSVEVIQQFVERDPRVRLIRNERNMGNIYNVNKFIQFTQGDYIYAAASDDMVLPGFFEKSMSLLEQYPQAGLCSTDCFLLIENTGEMIIDKMPCFNEQRYVSPGEFVKYMQMRFHPPIAFGSVVIKRAALIKAGGFIPELKWSADLFAVLVIAFRYGICYIPEPLMIFRIREDSFSSGYRQWPQQRRVMLNMIKLVETPAYQDVRSYFRQTSHFSYLPWQVLRVVLGNPQYWSYLSSTLLRFTLWPKIKMPLAKIAPLPIKHIYRHIHNKYWEVQG